MVSGAHISTRSRSARPPLTLVPLLLDLERLRQVLVLLPLDGRADRAVVDKVALVADLLLVQVRLLEHLVLKEVVRREVEQQFETGLLLCTWEVLDPDIGKALERLSIAVGDGVAEVDVGAEGGQPELRDARG